MNGKRETHESYATIQISRVNGTTGPLFGSKLENHNASVVLRIARADIEHSLGRDWIHSPLNADLIEVEMSASQFAEAITTLNVATGVPVTLRRFNGEQVSRAPSVPIEAAKIRTEFKKRMGSLADKCQSNIAEAEKLLGQKTLTKDEREQILQKLRMVMQEVSSNIPFALKSFEEATDKVVAEAKGTIDAFMTTAIHQEGLRAIGAAMQKPAVPALETPSVEALTEK